MQVTSLSVTLEKRVSDSDYGSERAEAHIACELSFGEDPVLALGVLLDEARICVERELRKSVTREVRKRLNPPLRLCDECGDPLGDYDQYLHAGCAEAQKERHQRERAEAERSWRERSVAELTQGATPPEVVAVGRGNGGQAPTAVFQSAAAGAPAEDDDLEDLPL